MTRWRFGEFMLDVGDRRLIRDGAPVELNGRYLDALALLVAEAGQLVTKDRFMTEVWHGVPVTDEALTQCIRTLRRVLGDQAANPRFIATVPKHGYRFIAPVERESDEPTDPTALSQPSSAGAWVRLGPLGFGGTVGGGVAGAAVGLFYGLAAATQPAAAAPGPGGGAASALLVLLCLGIAAGLIAGAGVAFGIAATGLLRAPRPWHPLVGGVLGGAAMGTAAKLVGLDAFTLLLGQSPGDITGPLEGGLSGAATGLALWLGAGRLRRSVLWAAAAGALAGIAIPLLGGRVLGGSLDLLTRQFGNAPLRLDRIGGWFGEVGFGPIAQIVTSALESAAFAAGVAGALVLARRTLPAGD